MVLEPIYLDLSSSDDEDEDPNWDRNDATGPTAFTCFPKVFNMDVEDDDLFIIDKPKSTGKAKNDRERVIRSAIDDDECCILDTDPGAVEATDIVVPFDTDELVMTGEKGPVACRDFPHARYLCVHFPFKTTLHSKYCSQCHCYVCDSLAPCAQWGEGNNSNDHCHASEEPRWKILRKVAKCGTVPSPVPPASGASAQAAATLSSMFGAENPTGVSRLAQSNLLQAHTSRSSPIVHSPLKRDPLIIKLKGKARGKASQLARLGVRSSRPDRPIPLSSLPGHRQRPPLRPSSTVPESIPDECSNQLPPRPSSTPSDRVQVDAIVSIPTQPLQLSQPTRSNPRHNPSTGRVATISALPLRSQHSVPTANPLSSIGDSAVPGFVSSVPHIPDSRYVPASALSDVNMAPVYEDQSSLQALAVQRPSVIISSDYVAQSYSSPVDSAAHIADILAGPIEGLEVDAVAQFDYFAITGIGAVESPGASWQATPSLNDVLEQMARDDFLWEQYPGL
ncbi:uncharacterized protein [Physcomitrium patens]|uniref:uncharacterized protein isoform X3 n=1 Tax=Physcomitrium patens TaxID=3218 RepID=UPI000D159A0E|nr:uncharacterized protein LOC112273688 isoform X3 [Physcomitrium patens]|eukprot:XP_024358527.1 uncharacterized protein LOC112273688 isoform X3 [Physcomitrella patens]